VRCGRYKWSLQQDGAPSHTARNTETCSVRTISSLSQTFCPPNTPDLNTVNLPLGVLFNRRSTIIKVSPQLTRNYRMALSLPISHHAVITFITFLFTVNVIRQMAPLFFKVDSNKYGTMFRMTRP